MSLSQFTNVKVRGFLTVLPERKINIDDEIQYYKDAKKLLRNKKILGLGSRHIVPEGVTASTLCEKAARILIEKLRVDVSEIDTLIMASINHDYNGNSDACIIQGNLGLQEECACFDTAGLGCTDVVYGLWLAHSLVQSGASKKCLFLEGSTSSLICDVRNRHSHMLFGDAGAAVLLERTEEFVPASFHLKSLGKEWKKIVTPAGGFRFPIRKDIVDIEVSDAEGNVMHLWDSIMKGGDVFKFAMEQAPESVRKILEYSSNKIDGIDFVAVHQANAQIVRTVVNHSGIPNDKASADTFTKFGNCGGTSVLVNLCDQCYNKNLRNVLMITFGVGLSVGTCILNLEDSYNGGIHFMKTLDNVTTREDLIKEWTEYLKLGNI